MMRQKATLKVMLVDDEPFMLKLLGRQLGNLGFSSPWAYTNGHEALDALAGPLGAPDLILLDLNMPEIDGIEFVRQLGERRFEGSLILVSGEDERLLQAASTLVRAHGIGLIGHLNKPASHEALAALLDLWALPNVTRPRSANVQYDADTLAAAIANGELVNYYQPKVAVADGRVVGVETLVRWRHPVDGLVFPDQFIGVAEANGQIDALTRVVLMEALAQTKVWNDAGLALRVAVNLSMDNLRTLDFADFIANQAAIVGVSPSNVVLEDPDPVAPEAVSTVNR
jgi:CheY-like chemotaxis protein